MHQLKLKTGNILIAFGVFLSCTCYTQSFAQNLTRAEVYSMQAGDVFVFSIDFDSKKRVDVDTILTRKEINSDSVVFTIKTSHFVFEPQLNNWIRTFEYSNKSYGNLSQNYFKKFTQSDTVIKLGDSTFTYGKDVLKDSFYYDSCGNLINERFKSSWTALSGSSESKYLAYQGVGDLLIWASYDNDYRYFRKKLLYMNKNGTTCGDSRIVKTINNDIELFSLYHQIKVYPNPSTGYIFIEWEQEGRYSLVNNLGELVLSGNFTDNIIDISQLQTGIYQLVLYSNGKTLYQTIVKE